MENETFKAAKATIQPIFNDWSACNLESDLFVMVRFYNSRGDEIAQKSNLIMTTKDKSIGRRNDMLSRNCDNIGIMLKMANTELQIERIDGLYYTYRNDGEVKVAPLNV
jgi:hypothetical protein